MLEKDLKKKKEQGLCIPRDIKKGNSKYKGPETRIVLACLRGGKEANEAGLW